MVSRINIRYLIILTLFSSFVGAGQTIGLEFNSARCTSYADAYVYKWSDIRYKYHYCFRHPFDCGHWVMWNLEKGYGGAFLPHKKWIDPIFRHNVCFYEDGSQQLTKGLLDYLEKVGFQKETYRPYQIPTGRPGDIVVWWNSFLQGPRHAGIFKDNRRVSMHSPDGVEEFTWSINGVSFKEVWVFRTPSKLSDCRNPLNFYGSESNAIGTWDIRHQYTCRWHERLYGEPPWSSNPTPYMCLKWEETNGTTWDTLISPRINLAGCSAVVFRQSCTTNPILESNKTIEIRGSTNDGASWTYLIGTDTTTKAELPWATNQRNVRIAWIYKGPVQVNRFWCIDDIQLLVKPGRNKDVCVSEILSPKGVISPGKIIVPYVVVQNSGPEFESLSVTLKIGSNYTDVKSIRLPYIYDSVLTFTPWTATPGNYTATCYSNLADDEFRGNDTATLNFKVAADTWVKMFPVYNGGVQTGACITSTGQETLFCVTGRSKFFASYLISQDL